MIRLSQERTRTLLALHGWSGVLLGLLLYAVILTGAIAVFADEIGHWSNPADRAGTAPLPAGLDARLRQLAATVKAEYHEEVSLFPRAGGVIQAFFHHHATPPGASQPENFGTEFQLAPQTLDVLSVREGFGDEVAAFDRANALADFLVELHVSLHIPAPWGLLVTGLLGLAMLVAAVTGLFVHRHLLRELFTIRRFREALLARRDAHVIAGTWNLPFAFVLAFTGSFFSFASSVGIPAMALVAFGGDQQALIETIVGLPPAEDRRPRALANLDAMLADARVRAGAEPAFVSIEHYGRADARVTVFTRPGRDELFSHNLVYAGASGAFVHEKPGLGLVPSVGGTAVDLMAPLHFGNFAGLLSKIVWFSLGFASAYVALTGLLLWTTRRADDTRWTPLARASLWVGFGLPLCLSLTPLGYFAGRAAGVALLTPPMTVAFLIAALGSAVAAWKAPLRHLAAGLLAATGAALLLVPLARWIAGGPGWIDALASGTPTVPLVDAALLLAGALCLHRALRRPVPRVDSRPDAAAVEVA